MSPSNREHVAGTTKAPLKGGIALRLVFYTEYGA